MIKYNKILTKEFLEKEYIQKEKYAKEIAEEIGCCLQTVFTALKKHNIKRLTKNTRKRKECKKYKKILPNQKFGRLTTIEVVGKKHKCDLWLCKCSCDKNKFHKVISTHLNNGSVNSCGCLTRRK